MQDHVIETSIDELVRIIKKKEKMNISEISDFLKMNQKDVEPLLNILEENGIIEIKYPVIGEPKVVLKSNLPEKINIKKTEKVEEIKPEIGIEKPSISEKMETRTEIVKNDETRTINKKMEELENAITDLSRKIDVSMLKEDLSEILLIVAGLRDIEKISFYLKEILSIIHKMKEKKIWTDEDKDLVSSMLKTIAENWREYKEEDIAKLFDEVKSKIETA